MLSKIRVVFQRRPLLTNVVTFGSLYVAAETTQQLILMRTDHNKKKLDWPLIGRYAIIGLACIGPVLFYWYRFLDAAIPAVKATAVAKKVFTDQAVSSPTCIALFFTGMSFLEGKDDVFAELEAKFWSTYKLSCCFWLPAQAINFTLLPPYTRVAFVGAASFVWVNVLCLVKRQQYDKEESDEKVVQVVKGEMKPAVSEKSAKM